MPLLSVIVPVFGDAAVLEACLSSIHQSQFQDYELVVADDGSPDAVKIADICERQRARLVRLETRSGPGPARNAAAGIARGEILVFIDSDETVHADSLDRIAAAFASDPSLDALVGSFDLAPGVQGLVAIFRNLLHAHVHHRSAGDISTFWAGCGAVRQSLFEQLGGFRAHPIEDVEFGIRLHQAGGRIRLDPSIQVKHHKAWTLGSMIRTDIFVRAAPWTELMMQSGLPKNLNFRWLDRATVLAAGLLPALAWLAIRYRGAWLGAAAVDLVAVAWMQWPLFRFLSRERGSGFAVASYPAYLAHQLSAAAGLVLGVVRAEVKRDRWLPWVGALALVLVLGVIQGAGGAYQAEFDGFPDEASHFLTGLMLRDYLTQWPYPNPIPWAEQYYLHYPRVAFGHWPPLFHGVEAVWWLFLTPSRFTAMLLIGLLGTAAALAFYRLARRMAPPAWALAATCVLIATPVFQQSAAWVMAEQLSLLLVVLLLDALASLVESGARKDAVKVAVYCGLAILVKGTGFCLVPAPFLALLIAGRRLELRKAVLPALAMTAVCAVWFWAQDPTLRSTLQWAGITGGTPWSLAPLVALAGPGILLVAGAGIVWLARGRESVAASAAATVLSAVAVSFFLRAMAEPRHWIVALPGLLLLGLMLVVRASQLTGQWSRIGATAILIAVMMVPFPWRFYRQHSAGSEQLINQLRLPARLLVSTLSAIREGTWVAMISEREKRPASVVVRSTKSVASVGFNGQHYRLRTNTPAEVEALLDRYAIDMVILDEYGPREVPWPHPLLLRKTVSESRAWRECARVAELYAYCRVEPPKLQRVPVQIDLRNQLGRFITEK